MSDDYDRLQNLIDILEDRITELEGDVRHLEAKIEEGK